MAITPTVGAAQNLDAATTHVWAFDSGASPKAIVVAIARASAKWAQGEWSVGGHNAGEVWGYIGDDIPSGANDVTVVTSNATTRSGVPMAFAASGPVALDTPVYSRSTAAGRIEFTMDSGTEPGIGIVAGSIKSTSGGNAPHAGTTEDLDRWSGAANLSVGHETAQGTGSRLIGFSYTWLCGAAGVMLVEQDIDITPEPWGMGLGFHAGTAAVGADRVVPGARMAPFTLRFRAGQVSAMAPRQVMLTGNDLETPEMTEGGTEGDVLTKHANRKPTWEDAQGGSGDVATDAVFDAKGDLAVGTGADTAIKRSVGSDGQVLTADSAETDGVKWAAPAAAPGEGTSFPGSPSTDERWYRTDHGLWFRYDGTRWLSEQLFRQPMPTNAVPSYSTQSNPSRLAFDDGFDIYLVAWHLTARIGATNDGSDNWEIAVLTQPDGTTQDSMDTSGWSPDTFTRYDAALDTVLDTDAAGDTTRLIQTRVKYNAGTPGDMNMFSSTLDHRIIAT